jgi:3-deoxy-D-manno-octulosonate 8-phosphate phosphatase (KDO 8-P phosphatase)
MNKQNINEDVIDRAKKIKLLLMDCDGVLTDGKLYYSERGEELKVFHVRDGQGLVLWHQAGFRSGIITGRKSEILKVRANELRIDFLKQNSKDKLKDFEEIKREANVSAEEVAYIGDDVVDILLLKKVGFAVSVSDAIEEVLLEVNYITRSKGGLGAVREVIDLIFHSKRT